LARRFLSVMGEGESEIRQMHDAPAFEAQDVERAQVAAT
jgi:hypothetical protein